MSNREQDSGHVIGERFMPTPPPLSLTPTPTPPSSPQPSQYDTGYTSLHTLILTGTPTHFWDFPASALESVCLIDGITTLHALDDNGYGVVPFANVGISGATSTALSVNGPASNGSNSAVLPTTGDYAVEFMIFVDDTVVRYDYEFTFIDEYWHAIGIGRIGNNGDSDPYGLYFQNYDTNEYTALPHFVVGRWNHIAMNYDYDTQAMNIYVNCQLSAIATAVIPFIEWYPIMPYSYETYNDATPLSALRMDTLALYDRQLTDTEIFNRGHLVLTSETVVTPAALGVPSVGGDSPPIPRLTPTPTPTPSFLAVTPEVSRAVYVDFTNVGFDGTIKTTTGSDALYTYGSGMDVVDGGIIGGQMMLYNNISLLDGVTSRSFSTSAMPIDGSAYTIDFLGLLPTDVGKVDHVDEFRLFNTRWLLVRLNRSNNVRDWTLSFEADYPHGLFYSGDTTFNIQHMLNGSRMFHCAISRTPNYNGVDESFLGFDYKIYINGSLLAGPFTVTADTTDYIDNEDYVQDIGLFGPNSGMAELSFYPTALSDGAIYTIARDYLSRVSIPEPYLFLYNHDKGRVSLDSINSATPIDFREIDNENSVVVFAGAPIPGIGELMMLGPDQLYGAGSSGVSGFIRSSLYHKERGFINPAGKPNNFVDGLVTLTTPDVGTIGVNALILRDMLPEYIAPPPSPTPAAIYTCSPETVLGDNPTFFYRFDETVGAAAVDATGNGNTGTYINEPTLGSTALACCPGTSVTLSGLARIESAPWTSTLNDDFSVEFQMQTTGTTGMPLISAPLTGSESYRFGFSFDANSGLHFGLDYTPGTGMRDDLVAYYYISDNLPHHIVFSFQGSLPYNDPRRMRVYVDGKIRATKGNWDVGVKGLNGTGPIVVGSQTSGLYGNPLTSPIKFDNLAFYDYSLDSRQVRRHYDSLCEVLSPAVPCEPVYLGETYKQNVLASVPKYYWTFDHVSVTGDMYYDIIENAALSGFTRNSYKRIGDGYSLVMAYDNTFNPVIGSTPISVCNQTTTIEYWFIPDPASNNALFTSSFADISYQTGAYPYIGIRARRPSLQPYDYYVCPSLSTTNWNHFAMVINRETNSVSVFINGEFIIEVETVILNNDYTSIEVVKGYIDEFAIYHRALNECELTAHYEAGLAEAVSGDETMYGANAVATPAPALQYLYSFQEMNKRMSADGRLLVIKATDGASINILRRISTNPVQYEITQNIVGGSYILDALLSGDGNTLIYNSRTFLRNPANDTFTLLGTLALGFEYARGLSYDGTVFLGTLTPTGSYPNQTGRVVFYNRVDNTTNTWTHQMFADSGTSWTYGNPTLSGDGNTAVFSSYVYRRTGTTFAKTTEQSPYYDLTFGEPGVGRNNSEYLSADGQYYFRSGQFQTSFDVVDANGKPNTTYVRNIHIMVHKFNGTAWERLDFISPPYRTLTVENTSSGGVPTELFRTQENLISFGGIDDYFSHGYAISADGMRVAVFQQHSSEISSGPVVSIQIFDRDATTERWDFVKVIYPKQGPYYGNSTTYNPDQAFKNYIIELSGDGSIVSFTGASPDGHVNDNIMVGSSIPKAVVKLYHIEPIGSLPAIGMDEDYAALILSEHVNEIDDGFYSEPKNYWRGVAGGVISDTIAGNDLTTSSGAIATSLDGISGNSVSFTNAVATFESTVVVDNNFTLEAWINPTAFGFTMFANDDGSLRIAVDANGYFSVHDSLVVNTGFKTFFNLGLNIWNHVAIKSFNNKVIVIFLNGQFAGFGKYSQFSDGRGFTVFGGNSSAATDGFTGKLSDLVYYNYELSWHKINNHYMNRIAANAITRTPIPSNTPTPTPTPTVSITPTITPTVSITPTITPTVSLTRTVTPTPSITPTITPTISVTPTVTPTISLTPSVTPSAQLPGTVSGTQVTPIGPASLTLIQNGSADDASRPIIVPFSFFFNGVDYGNSANGGIHVGSNSYVTFGAASSAYSGLSASNPGKAILINAKDNSYQRVYAGSEFGGNAYRVRYEGSGGTSGTVGSPTVVWEITFYKTQQIRLVMGVLQSSGLTGVSNGTTFVPTFVADGNTSYVITDDAGGAGTGLTWTVQTGSISDPPPSTPPPTPTPSPTIGTITYGTLDPSTANPNIILTNGNLTANVSGGTNNNNVRAETARSSGKFYFEATITSLGNFLDIGLVGTSVVLNQGSYISQSGAGLTYEMDTSSLQSHNTGGAWVNLTYRYPVVGDVIQLAIDLDAKVTWFRFAGQPTWAEGGDPASGTTATSAYATSEAMKPAIGLASCGLTMNFGATPFVGPVPAGFSPWG